MLQSYLKNLPLIAILRGLTPDEAIPVGKVLADAGFSIIEVPMNSPEPLTSIRRMSTALGQDYLIGAGTVTSPEWIPDIAEAGGRLIVMPHADLNVITAAKAKGLYCTPGVATPTEGFAALHAGADGLKFFPAELITPQILKAMRSVFPKSALFFPVGGITPDNMSPYVTAGANGFGLGSALYKPGMSLEDISDRARKFVSAWKTISNSGIA